MGEGPETKGTPRSPDDELSRRALLSRGLKGAGGLVVAGWVAPTIASARVSAQTEASPPPDEPKGREITRGDRVQGLAFTGSDLLAALLAAAAALGAGSASQYASRKRKRKRSHRAHTPRHAGPSQEVS